jgi:hypothetical protein
VADVQGGVQLLPESYGSRPGGFPGAAASIESTTPVLYLKWAHDSGGAPVPGGVTTWRTGDQNSAPPGTPVGAWENVHILARMVVTP